MFDSYIISVMYRFSQVHQVRHLSFEILVVEELYSNRCSDSSAAFSNYGNSIYFCDFGWAEIKKITES